MAKPIWFPFYPNDFLSSSKVALMSNDERGGYILLLCHEWNDPHCRLPADEESLRKLSQLRGDLTLVKSCFTQTRGTLINERLYKEWIKVNEQKALASLHGKQGAMKRWIATPLATPSLNHSSSPSPSPSPRTKNQEPSESPSEEMKTSGTAEDSVPSVNGVATWKAYSEAYRGRYHVDPVRNQQTNSHLKNLVKRIGSDEAPAVASFFLTHNDPFYTKSRHATSLLLRDCEGLRTQWATGTKVTTGELKNAEFKDNVVEQVKRIEALRQGERT